MTYDPLCVDRNIVLAIESNPAPLNNFLNLNIVSLYMLGFYHIDLNISKTRCKLNFETRQQIIFVVRLIVRKLCLVEEQN